MKLKSILQIIFFALIVKPFLTVFIGLRIFGKNNLPKNHPFIIIANHSSHLDATTLLSLFPLNDLKNIRPVAAADYFERNKFISFFSKTFFNILPIPMKDITKQNNPIEIMEQAIKEKQTLIVFPEGTRSPDGHISDFRSGIAHFIKDYPEIPIIPIYLSNLWKSLPKGEWLPIPFFCDVLIGEQILIKGDRKQAVELMKKAVIDLSKEI